MTQAAAAVLADALRLDEHARAELAAELIASLDGPADPDAESQWATEIERGESRPSNRGPPLWSPGMTSGAGSNEMSSAGDATHPDSLARVP